MACCSSGSGHVHVDSHSQSNSDKSKLVLIGDYDYNHSMVLKNLVRQIQKLYDLNPKIILLWMESEHFKSILKKLDIESFRETMNREHPLLNQLLDATHPDSYIDQNMSWEKEKCGHIVESYSNGYVQYCNGHRYLHITREPIHKLEKNIDGDTNKIDHYFVSKTSKEILDEIIFKLKFNLYVDYTHLLVSKLISDFEQFMGRSHIMTFVVEENFNQLSDWLKGHPSDFREKKKSYHNSGGNSVNRICVKTYFKRHGATKNAVVEEKRENSGNIEDIGNKGDVEENKKMDEEKKIEKLKLDKAEIKKLKIPFEVLLE